MNIGNASEARDKWPILLQAPGLWELLNLNEWTMSIIVSLGQQPDVLLHDYSTFLFLFHQADDLEPYMRGFHTDLLCFFDYEWMEAYMLLPSHTWM